MIRVRCAFARVSFGILYARNRSGPLRFALASCETAVESFGLRQGIKCAALRSARTCTKHTKSVIRLPKHKQHTSSDGISDNKDVSGGDRNSSQIVAHELCLVGMSFLSLQDS